MGRRPSEKGEYTMIFVSTGGIKEKSGADVSEEFIDNNIRGIELSGGCFDEGQLPLLKKMSEHATFQVHNYFPPPKLPFVLNLASNDSVIAKRSVEHVKNSMRWAVDLRRPVYSFHAGFLIDPQVKELGNPIKKRELINRDLALSIFGERISSLAEYARKEGVTLLIENNVLSSDNMNSFNADPMLFSHPEEIVSFMNVAPTNVGLLLDVAHLKVSAKTLGYDLLEAHNMVSEYIRGYHLSDNDGLSDSNKVVTDDSWFWNVIKNNLDYYSIEVYGVPITDLFRQHELVTNKLSEK